MIGVVKRWGAFERLSQTRGCPVPETEEQRQWVEALAAELVENRA